MGVEPDAAVQEVDVSLVRKARGTV